MGNPKITKISVRNGKIVLPKGNKTKKPPSKG